MSPQPKHAESSGPLAGARTYEAPSAIVVGNFSTVTLGTNQLSEVDDTMYYNN